MAAPKRTRADGAAFIALAVVALVVNIGLAALTDLDVAPRWGLTVVSGILAAGAAYAVVTRRDRSTDRRKRR